MYIIYSKNTETKYKNNQLTLKYGDNDIKIHHFPELEQELRQVL